MIETRTKNEKVRFESSIDVNKIKEEKNKRGKKTEINRFTYMTSHT